MDAPESPEALQARHRKEQRDLVTRITQKKKGATKKTRKGVNDECERLEQDLKQRQAAEVAALDGSNVNEGSNWQEDEQHEVEEDATNGIAEDVAALSMAPPAANPPTPDGPKKKTNRAKARLARRAAEQAALAAQAAEEAANMPDQREVERSQMLELFKQYGLQEVEIRADGHCLYSAVADQLEARGLGLKPQIQPAIIGHDGAQLPPFKTVRHVAADTIAQAADDFVPFIEEPLDSYLRKIRETGEWGGHMELMALARAYGISINVLHADGRVDKVEPAEGSAQEGKEIWLGYYKHGFGLGEHYNSLRKAP